MQKNRFRRYATGVLLTLVSVLIMLLLGEGVLRLCAPNRTMGTLLVPDKVFGFRHAKNMETSYLFSGRYVTMRTNNLGLRQDEPIAAKKAADEKRILFLGDSYLFGWGVNYEEMFFTKLKEKAQAAFPNSKLTFINAGHGAWGTPQMLTYLEGEGLALKPDAVVMVLGQTSYEYTERAQGLYKLNEAGKIEKEANPQSSGQNRSTLAKSPVLDWLNFHSYLFQMTKPGLVFMSGEVAKLVPGYKRLLMPAEPEKTRLPAAVAATGIDPALKFTQELFTRLSQVTRQHRLPLLVMGVGIGSSSTLNFWKNNAPWFAENQIPFSSMVDHMESARSKMGTDEILFGDLHFNPKGSAVYAEGAWPHLKKVLDQCMDTKLAAQTLISP